MSLWFMYLVFFKQKKAYEMRISDWSSDVCSSDLPSAGKRRRRQARRRWSPCDLGRRHAHDGGNGGTVLIPAEKPRNDNRKEDAYDRQIGRASCRERVCQYV